MQAFKKVDKVHNVKDNSVLEVSEYYLVANNVGLGEAVCARQGSRVGRHSGMGIVSSNYSHWVRPSSVPEKKETAPGNVKHEVANYVSLKHGHWAPQCGMQIKVRHLQTNVRKMGPIIPAITITVLRAWWLLFITMRFSFQTPVMDWRDHQMCFERQAICDEKRNFLYLCTKRSAFHRHGKSRIMILL